MSFPAPWPRTCAPLTPGRRAGAQRGIIPNAFVHIFNHISVEQKKEFLIRARRTLSSPGSVCARALTH